jgi:hypothetical protein
MPKLITFCENDKHQFQNLSPNHFTRRTNAEIDYIVERWLKNQRSPVQFRQFAIKSGFSSEAYGL